MFLKLIQISNENLQKSIKINYKRELNVCNRINNYQYKHQRFNVRNADIKVAVF